MPMWIAVWLIFFRTENEPAETFSLRVTLVFGTVKPVQF
jgi:hypothetical protein